MEPKFFHRDDSTNQSMMLKGQGHVTVNKPVISIIYIVAHTWLLCSAQILVDGVNPQESYFQKSINISAIVQHECFVCFSTKLKSTSSNNTFIFRKIVENLCDMAYQKYCQIVILKEVCLHYVTLPFKKGQQLLGPVLRSKVSKNVLVL